MSLTIAVGVQNLVEAKRLLDVLGEQGFIVRDLDPLGGALVAVANPSTPGPLDAASVAPPLLSKARQLKRAASRRVWLLCLEAARNSQPGVAFGIAEIAAWANQQFGDALARIRVLGRPEKRLGFKVFERIEGSSPTQYEMTPQVRAAILQVG